MAVNRMPFGPMRLFIDTCVIIDYMEGLARNAGAQLCKDLKQYRWRQSIVAETSKLALMEAIEVYRKDLYVVRRIRISKWMAKRAHRCCEKLENVGEIGGVNGLVSETECRYANIIGRGVHLTEFFCGGHLEEVVSLTELLLRETKFSLKDALLFTSAALCGYHFFTTSDGGIVEHAEEARQVAASHFGRNLDMRVLLIKEHLVCDSRNYDNLAHLHTWWQERQAGQYNPMGTVRAFDANQKLAQMRLSRSVARGDEVLYIADDGSFYGVVVKQIVADGTAGERAHEGEIVWLTAPVKPRDQSRVRMMSQVAR